VAERKRNKEGGEKGADAAIAAAASRVGDAEVMRCVRAPTTLLLHTELTRAGGAIALTWWASEEATKGE
jgi:hypothetical protein